MGEKKEIRTKMAKKETKEKMVKKETKEKMAKKVIKTRTKIKMEIKTRIKIKMEIKIRIRIKMMNHHQKIQKMMMINHLINQKKTVLKKVIKMMFLRRIKKILRKKLKN